MGGGPGWEAGAIPVGTALALVAFLPRSWAKDIPSHWPSSARANGEEWASDARGSSPERKARQGHDTKRSDWRDPGRLEPGRRHKNQPHDHAERKTHPVIRFH